MKTFFILVSAVVLFIVAPNKVYAQTRSASAIVTSIIVGKSIRFPVVKLSDQAKADRINKHLKDHYWNADSDSKKTFRANLLASFDELGYKLVLNSPNILSIEISWRQYRAGDTTQHHFDLSTGYTISLDQIIMPSKWSEVKKLVLNDSKKRFVRIKNEVTKDMRTGGGGWNGGIELWFEKDVLGASYEDAFQTNMKKQYWEIELEKTFTLSKNGIGFHYMSGFGFPMSIRELEPNSEYFYSWAVLKPSLKQSSPISSLVK